MNGGGDAAADRGTRLRVYAGALTGGALVAALIVGVHGTGQAAARSAPAPTSAPTASAAASTRSGACLVVGASSREGEAYCLRKAADAMKRVPIPDDRQGTASAVAQRVQAAAHQADWEQCRQASSPSYPEGQCVSTIGSRPAGAEDVEAVRWALAEAGYQNVVARIARPDDPAFPHTVIYAVATDGLCVVASIRGGHQGYTAEGPYADGRCLEP
ncbi:hypothetical protein HC031_21760 [Planosporangium thailandense]|uniref:Uncharacterized protein n=1 Tax=Planosporangium thailandense TaxID=765197 RepID=A0ABX0Y2G2_9ACTN|nr:hypothetical protein [Planosporangium thailandense]NJC72322.1 hypothetical protein [Planosporangium thailandense]